MALASTGTEAANEDLVRQAMVQVWLRQLVEHGAAACRAALHAMVIVALPSPVAALWARQSGACFAALPVIWFPPLQIQSEAGLGSGPIAGLSPSFTLRANGMVYDLPGFLAMWRNRRVGAWGACAGNSRPRCRGG